MTMVKVGKSTCKRIRSVRLSLENAEQSFLDNKDMRGELDLMLAEAELKNLRRKQTFPWSWNRQLLALCVASLLVLASAGGWYYANLNQPAPLVPARTATVLLQVESTPQTVQNSLLVSPSVGEAKVNKKSKEYPQGAPTMTRLENVDIKQLVHSARAELSSSN